MAKSTFCRKCSEYFAITPSVVAGGAKEASSFVPPSARPAGKVAFPPSVPPAERAPTRPAGASTQTPATPTGGGLREMLGGFLASKPKTRTAHCFECTSWHEISSSAQSTTCKACGAYIDLQDYKINGSFSRNIKTRGSVYLSSKGDLSSSKIVCSQATIHGKMRGNLQCDGMVTVRMQGRLHGSVEAGEMIIEKGAEVVFARPLKASSVAVYGKMSGQVLSDSHVTIYKSGSLDGAVNATGFTVEKGGIFQGELTITPRQVISQHSPDSTDALGGEQPPSTRVLPMSTPSFLGGESKPAHG